MWLAGGVETDSPKGKIIRWSQPEIALYDDDPFIRMSYPDLVEEGGKYYLTETQKDLGQQIAATSHRVEKTARDLIREQVETLTQRSKTTLQSLNGRIDAVGGRSEALELRIEQLEGHLTRMAARLIELEKPRGLRRLWALLTGKRRRRN